MANPGRTEPRGGDELPPPEPRSAQQDLEESAPGRGLITLLVAAILASTLVWNLPASALKATLQPVVEPFVAVTGTAQSWEIFAPDPRRTSIDLYGCVEYTDGSESIWHVPEGGLLAAYRSYRWRKWMEHARLDSRQDLWEPAAIYLARLHTNGEKTPSRVTLIRRWADVPSPGSEDEPRWHEYAFYALALDSSASAPVEGECNVD